MSREKDPIDALFAMRRSDYLKVVGLGLAQAVALVAFVLLLRSILAGFQPGDVSGLSESQYQRSVVMAGVMAGLGLLLGVLRAWEFSLAETAGYEVVRRLRMAMYAHLQRMLPEHLRHRARGGLLLRLTGDLSMLRMWLSRGVLQGTSALMVMLAGLIMIGWLSVWLLLAVVATYAVGAAVSLTNGRAMREATRTMRRRRSLLIGNIDEQINSLSVLQVSGRSAGEYSRLSRQNDSLTRALIRVARLRGRLRGLATATSLVATASVLLVGLIESHRATVTMGDVLAAALATRLLSRPARTLGLTHDYWHRGLVSRQKVVDFLRSRSRDQAEDALPALRVRRGAVSFESVTVPGRLTDVTLRTDGGRLVAITGTSGEGGSALLDLVARQVDPSSGMVLVDGQDLQATSPASAARAIGVAGPDLPLLRGSIRRNLTYAARDADDTEIQRVYYALGLDRIAPTWGPDGVHAWVTEGGHSVPAAHRQLVALARAFMGSPPIILLDEPMAGLDQNQRAAVRELLLRHRGTVLMVTTDADDIALADEVWIIEDGTVRDALSGEHYRDRAWLSRLGVAPHGA